MAQHGQVLKLRARRSDGKAVWAYRYRVDGRCSKRPQVGGFATRAEAQRALNAHSPNSVPARRSPSPNWSTSTSRFTRQRQRRLRSCAGCSQATVRVVGGD